jgi:hypothetical protein
MSVKQFTRTSRPTRSGAISVQPVSLSELSRRAATALVRPPAFAHPVVRQDIARKSAEIVDLDQMNSPTEPAARTVEIRNRHLGAALHLLAELGILSRDRGRQSDQNVGPRAPSAVASRTMANVIKRRMTIPLTPSLMDLLAEARHPLLLGFGLLEGHVRAVPPDVPYRVGRRGRPSSSKSTRLTAPQKRRTVRDWRDAAPASMSGR